MTNNNNIDADIKALEEKLEKLKQVKAQVGQMQSAPNPYAVPVAVLIAGILIAGAVFYSGGKNSAVVNSGQITAPSGNTAPRVVGNIDDIKPVTKEDHIRGDINAPVKIVEFSDFECPFCKKFHPTMQRIVDEYGKDGKVAWIYRHFPLDSIHPFKARNEAKASECVAELGGNEAFWKFADEIFRITPSNNQLDQSLLPQIAETAGVNRADFEACMKTTKYDQHIEDNLQDAIASGGTGTPYSVLIAPNGQKFPISGAQPYSAVKSLVEIALESE